MENIEFLTERLKLRTLRQDDAVYLIKWLGDDRVSKYMPYSTYTSVDKVREWILSGENSEMNYYFSVLLIETGEMIGNSSMEYSEERELWSFGYNYDYEHWGKGYATEAVKGMMEFIRGKYGDVRFGADAVFENIASQRVIEKCGLSFSHLGTMDKMDKSASFVLKYYYTR